ncbi:MAG: hypothetical protein CEN91_102 [Candidatus Berkelbacteria bacterium Licking1014_85]|uniref:Predicted 3'-5' exonuclease PolB-like domain-containing protein n=1 Tax=Candidatus Berkelbacteria bacterium Licking1014_85 TaxID=2017148 RepID=A0A554LLX2_9BACT|nr:MAG: hypothetical protein CEN91_102 [Candidatus Berkelbacteria bacterium Licking1014_85]
MPQLDNKIFLDIETIPVGKDKLAIANDHYKFLIEKKKINDKITEEEFIRDTALSGDFGQILCIGFAKNNDPVEIISGDEKEMLKNFWIATGNCDLFIGHNLMNFDLPFIYKRSIIHGIRPTKDLSFARYRNFPIYDTMCEWNKWSNTSTSLDKLAKIFDLESSKQGIDGSQVYDFYLAGKSQEIYDYCKRDVELTRKIYKRLIFES